MPEEVLLSQPFTAESVVEVLLRVVHMRAASVQKLHREITVQNAEM